MIRGKKAGIVSLFFVILMFVILWALVLSDILKTGGQMMVDGGVTGVEAFFYTNINYFVFLIFVLSILGWFALGGGSG